MAAPQALAHPPPAALFRSPPVTRRESDLGAARRSRNLWEVAGGATADVAAVACCFPLAVVDLAVLTVYKVPAGICRKAWKNNRRQRIKRRRKALSLPPNMYRRQGLAAALDGGDDDMSLMRARRDDFVEMDDSVWGSDDVGGDTWQQIHGNGFWRSDDPDDYYDHRFQH